MGAAVEIRDIKIINQCLEVQEGVLVLRYSFFVCLPLYVHLSILFLSLKHFVFCAFRQFFFSP